MNRLINKLQGNKKFLNIYITAGYPNLTDTVSIISSLQNSGADIVELGMPYSDPLADGTTIQESNNIALNNGMTIKTMFEQIDGIRKEVDIPIILMGYLNPIWQFGVDKFLQLCKKVGIDGLIIPDLPLHEFVADWKPKLTELDICFIQLVTPQTPTERIKLLDDNSNGFLYVVAQAGITGGITNADNASAFLQKLKELNLKNKILAGFGIRDKESFKAISEYTNGAIIGSAFINHLKNSKNVEDDTKAFVQSIIG